MGNIGNSLSRGLSKVVLVLRKKSPEILMGLGITGFVATVITACKETTKAEKHVEEAKKNLATLHDIKEKGIDFWADNEPHKTMPMTEKEYKKNVTMEYFHLGRQLVKDYAPSVILGISSIACMASSHKIMSDRNAALTATCTALDASLAGVLSRVRDRFGEDVMRDIKYGVKDITTPEEMVDEKTGEKKTVVKTDKAITVVDNEILGNPYAKFFDEGCPDWEPNAEHNLAVLIKKQNIANDRLRGRGYLFLNDVYDMLGIPRTKAGQVVGWRYKPNDPAHVGDNFVDFGIYNLKQESNRDFVNGYEPVILLDFNVDGNIWELM
jgi:hypothetical protein